MIKAVIFDMDGVLIDSMPYWKEAIKETVTDIGSGFTEELWQDIKGKRLDEVVFYWKKHRPWSKKYTTKEVEKQVLENVIALVKDEGKALPGVYKVLKYIQAKSIPMAIASSSYMSLIEVVTEKLNIASFFKIIHSAEKEEKGKPHPGVYIHTAEKLQVDPTDCMVFEDSINGMIAAKAAKMICVAIPDQENKNDPKVQIADFVLSSLEDVDESIL
jgi:sugar-phosphatase